MFKLSSYAILLAVCLPGLMPAQSADFITVIKKERAEIDSHIQSYKKEETGDSTSHSAAFSKDSELKLIRVEVKQDGLQKKVEWYFAGGELIYCEQTWMEESPGLCMDHQEFYLHEGHLMAWLKQGKQVDINSEEFKYLDAALVSYGKKMLSLHSD